MKATRLESTRLQRAPVGCATQHFPRLNNVGTPSRLFGGCSPQSRPQAGQLLIRESLEFMSWEATEEVAISKTIWMRSSSQSASKSLLCITWLTVCGTVCGSVAWKMSARQQRHLGAVRPGCTQGSSLLTSAHLCGTRPGVSVAPYAHPPERQGQCRRGPPPFPSR